MLLECGIVMRRELALQAWEILCGDATWGLGALGGLECALVAVLLEVTVDAGGADDEAFGSLLWGAFIDFDGVDNALSEVGADSVHGLVCIILNRKENRCEPPL